MLLPKSLVCSLFAVSQVTSLKIPLRSTLKATTLTLTTLLPLPILGDITNQIDALLSGVVDDATYQKVFSLLNQLQIGATPTTVSQATAVIAKVYASPSPSNIFDAAAALIDNGITPGNLSQVVGVLGAGCNSQSNVNPPPPTPVYPKKGADDAPYDVSEESLRGAIQIPSTFTYGQKPPVILAPGTGTTGCISFSGNYIKLLSGKSYADPVVLNIPGFLNDDAQTNAEYVAYAINYISAISNGANVSVLAWSQGNIDTQWALKYWPSTRNVTSDLISISPDFHGTVIANFICPGIGGTTLNPCAPAVLQQTYNSNFISTLRSNGGDSAYVPTTTIYSATDEVVQPQAGTGASAFINDARGVGVSNTQVQVACPGLPAGGVYTHEGVLYNPLAFALAVDALTHSGPGDLSRIDLATVCSQVLAPGLGVTDLVLTEEAVVVAAATIVLYEPKVVVEPPIKSYAAS